MQVNNCDSPKGNSLCKKTSYNIQIVSVHPFFAQTILLPQILYFTMLFNWPDIPKVPLPMGWGHLHSYVIHVLWMHPIQHSRLHLDRLSCFSTAHSSQQWVRILYNSSLI